MHLGFPRLFLISNVTFKLELCHYFWNKCTTMDRMSDSESGVEDSDGPRMDEWDCESENRMADGKGQLPKPGQDERHTSDFDFLKKGGTILCPDSDDDEDEDEDSGEAGETMGVSEDEEIDNTHGLWNPSEFGDDANPWTDYKLGVDKYGSYAAYGSIALLEKLRSRVTIVEARVLCERAATSGNWRLELDRLESSGGDGFLDDTDACVFQYCKGSGEFHASYGGWYEKISGGGADTNPVHLYTRAKTAMLELDDRAPWVLQAFVADMCKGSHELEQTKEALQAPMKGMYTVVFTNRSELVYKSTDGSGAIWMRTDPPDAEHINRERAKRAAKRKTVDEPDAPPTKRTRESKTCPGFAGGGAMPFIVGSKRAVTKDVQAKRPAPTDRQEPQLGMVPYRTDAVEHNPIGERECAIEAVRAALGSNRYTRASLGLAKTGDLNLKDVAYALQTKTAFRFAKSPPVRWSGLITKPQGIYIGRARLKDGEAHYMVYDAWRHIMFVGGAPPPAAPDPIEHLMFEDAPAPTPDVNVGRSWFVEEHELLDPSKFQDYMCKTMNVVRAIDNLYRVDMVAKHARKTDYNTPEHYD